MVSDGIPPLEFVAMRRGLDELSGGDANVLHEFVGLLADSLRRSSTMLVDAVDAGRRQQISQAAHMLRGTSLTSGLLSIALLAERIELGQTDGDALPAAATRLRALVEHAITVVRATQPGEDRQ